MTTRFAAPSIKLVVRLAIAAALAVALFAALAMSGGGPATASAAAKSKSCSGILNCNTIIDVGGVEVDIHADRVLSDNEVANVEDNVIKVLNDNNCNVITVACQDNVKLFLLNNVLVWARAPITVLGITVVKL